MTAVGGLLLAGPGSTLAAQTPRERFAGLIAGADSAWTARRYPQAKAGYRDALAIDSTGSSRATYRLAVLSSWDGDLVRAIGLFRQYTVLEPRDDEGRLALARAHAWHGETDRAVALYDGVLRRDSTYRDALLGAAQAEAWAGRFAPALARYDRWLRSNGRDVEVELARARTLAWAGRLAEAERGYAAVAARGERLEADKGVALVAAWRGDLVRSERLWRALAERVPSDPEAWVGLAQVLRWSGRPDDARDALGRALAADPAHADAAAQLRWVRGDLARTFEPMVTVAWDSDHNRSLLIGDAASFRPFRRGRLAIAGSRRHAELGTTEGNASSGRLSLQFGVGRRLSLTLEGGATRTSAGNPTFETGRTRAIGSVAATAELATGFTVGASARRSVFDETAALMASAIEVTGVAAETELALGGRWFVAAGGERASLTGGSGPNERLAGFGSLRWRVSRPVTVAISGRGFGYEERRQDGYFSPASYRLGEVSFKWTPGRDLGWAGLIELAGGAQQVRFDPDPASTRGTQRVAVGIAYRPRPGAEFGVDYAFSNVSATSAGPTGGSIYRAQVVSLRTRFLW